MVAHSPDRGMAQVAPNRVAGRPGVASAIFGATTLDHVLENRGARSFEIPTDLKHRLEKSALGISFPRTLFEGEVQTRVHGGAAVAAKRRAMHRRIERDEQGPGSHGLRPASNAGSACLRATLRPRGSRRSPRAKGRIPY